jgi:hypothetical protein
MRRIKSLRRSAGVNGRLAAITIAFSNGQKAAWLACPLS